MTPSLQTKIERIGLTFLAHGYYGNEELQEIADHLKVPFRALQNNLVRYRAFDSNVPVHFHLMTRMPIPRPAERFHIGVVVLPMALVGKRRVLLPYEDDLNANIQAVLSTQRLVNPRQSPIIEAAYHAMKTLKGSVDQYHRGVGAPKTTLTVECAARLCTAYYTSIYDTPVFN